MSAKAYNKLFPRYVRYNQERPIPSWLTVMRPTMLQVPIYYLGWMIKAEDIGSCGGMFGILQYFVRPNWFKHGCQPTEQHDFDRQGLMMPEPEVFGDNHVFIRIARNDRAGMKYLHTEAGIKEVVRQAFLALGLKEGSFDPFKDLIRVRWPMGEKFPEPNDSIPRIGEHYWPHKELRDRYVADLMTKEEYEQAVALAEERDAKNPPESKGTLPQVPPEVVYFITQKYNAKQSISQ